VVGLASAGGPRDQRAVCAGPDPRRETLSALCCLDQRQLKRLTADFQRQLQLKRLRAGDLQPELPQLRIHPVPDPPDVVHLVVMPAAQGRKQRELIHAWIAVVHEQLLQRVADEARAIAFQGFIPQAAEMLFIPAPVLIALPAQPARVDSTFSARTPEGSLECEHGIMLQIP
jgi:hypothetical protein